MQEIQQQQYKYKLAFSQNVKGVISFDGNAYFDEKLDTTNVIQFLEGMLREAELYVKGKGHKISSEVQEDKPKTK